VIRTTTTTMMTMTIAPMAAKRDTPNGIMVRAGCDFVSAESESHLDLADRSGVVGFSEVRTDMAAVVVVVMNVVVVAAVVTGCWLLLALSDFLST
jgi:hypothetical protein